MLFRSKLMDDDKASINILGSGAVNDGSIAIWAISFLEGTKAFPFGIGLNHSSSRMASSIGTTWPSKKTMISPSFIFWIVKRPLSKAVDGVHHIPLY